jgi:hypothetical protein
METYLSGTVQSPHTYSLVIKCTLLVHIKSSRTSHFKQQSQTLFVVPNAFGHGCQIVDISHDLILFLWQVVWTNQSRHCPGTFDWLVLPRSGLRNDTRDKLGRSKTEATKAKCLVTFVGRNVSYSDFTSRNFDQRHRGFDQGSRALG